MPEPSDPRPLREERVTFENWEADGCYVFVGNKQMATLNTPESSALGDPYNTFLDEWISPEEFCTTLEAVLRALGASSAVLAGVEQQRRNYQDRPVTPPARTKADLMSELGITFS